MAFAAVLLLLPALRAASDAAAVAWRPTEWQGEAAVEAGQAGWRAVVSIERGRLVFLGPDGGANLLFATPSREHREGWGGHRVWLGPQPTWPSGGWPPPDAWEKSAAAEVTIDNEILQLRMPSAGHGWPDLTRTYRWHAGRLVCGVTVHSNGERPAQVVQILQMPTTTRVRARLQPEPDWPAGYVGLPAAGRRPDFQVLAEPPPHAFIDGNVMHLRHLGQVEKLGFRPHPLEGELDDQVISVGIGAVEGEAVGAPDEGFYTQVYLGRPDTFVELEQLSPLWKPGTTATFEMIVEPLHQAAR